jgi:hypothetical protein
MKRVLVVGSLLLLSGCISARTDMRDGQGRTAYCSTSGFGLIGMAVAWSSYEDCKDRYEAAGYRP